uniref:NB-ARC domain containing protein n=1 Tax=Solanum tuberosum TaxID=4113 RepID=M1D9K9_SOLTU
MNSGAREIVPHEVMCFNTFDALIVHEINSSQVNSTNELVISKEKQGVTSTLRWIDIADEEEEQVTSPPMQKKLSPTAPAFVPSSAKLVTPRQGLSPSTNVAAILSDRLVSSNIEKLASLALININKQLQVGGTSTLSPNKFANLDDEDISEEGEEEEMLDYCFATAARNADISPRQQHNNKTKHERKHSWDGKVTEEFVPRQLPMQLAKQNHMTVSTTSTRFNKAKK